MKDLPIIKKACFSGYRPEKFDFELNKNNESYKRLISRLGNTVRSLLENGCDVFYCGMAPGFDIIAAECVILLKKKNKNVRLICAIPYLNHEDFIQEEWHRRYQKVLQNSDEIVYIGTEYHISCFQARNRYMVDNTDCVICWYDGKAGGTRNTIKYAMNSGSYVINLNTDYEPSFNCGQEKLPL